MRITLHGDRPDQPKDCRTNEFGRDGFRIKIFITENNLRFSEIVLGHKQLQSMRIGYSKSERFIYLFEEIDNDYRCSGRLFRIPWLDTYLLRDLIRRDPYENKTEADKLRGHFKRIYSQNHWRVISPIHNQKLEDKVQIVHWQAEFREFAGADKHLPKNAIQPMRIE